MTEVLRLDRQLRIPAWRQELLSNARIAVVGDTPLLTSLFLLGTAALGINQVTVIAPALDGRLLALAQGLNPQWRLCHLPGHLSQPAVADLLRSHHLWLDLGSNRLADKILFTAANRWQKPLIRALPQYSTTEGAGWKVFVYLPGREWQEILEVLAPEILPSPAAAGDGVLDIILAGIILEETKTILFGLDPSPLVLQYRQFRRPRPKPGRLAVIGAGALGNFVALGLALAGFTRITFYDPDVVELTNLNRQIFFGGAVGQPKALALAAALQNFGVPGAVGRVEYFTADTVQEEVALVFDCVDNFASRLAISRWCEAAGIPLVSGGTDYARGQVVYYHSVWQPQSLAELLDLERLAQAGSRRLGRAACLYQPNPAVIMTNQVIGGFMVEVARQLLSGFPGFQVFYDALAPQRFEVVPPTAEGGEATGDGHGQPEPRRGGTR